MKPLMKPLKKLLAPAPLAGGRLRCRRVRGAPEQTGRDAADALDGSAVFARLARAGAVESTYGKPRSQSCSFGFRVESAVL